MNGTQFYSFAISLAKGPGPAEFRSCTSRAYYGAYHRARELIEHYGVSLPGGTEWHKKVRWILDQSNDAAIKKASAKLNSLRDARNDADYQLSDLQPENARSAEFNLRTAKEIIDLVDAYIASGKSPGRTAIREYSKDTLKLIVR
ncbi:MAG TPA: hypothetical protein VIK18_26170 [Pirellulales bacterium]